MGWGQVGRNKIQGHKACSLAVSGVQELKTVLAALIYMLFRRYSLFLQSIIHHVYLIEGKPAVTVSRLQEKRAESPVRIAHRRSLGIECGILKIKIVAINSRSCFRGQKRALPQVHQSGIDGNAANMLAVSAGPAGSHKRCDVTARRKADNGGIFNGPAELLDKFRILLARDQVEGILGIFIGGRVKEKRRRPVVDCKGDLPSFCELNAMGGPIIYSIPEKPGLHLPAAAIQKKNARILFAGIKRFWQIHIHGKGNDPAIVYRIIDKPIHRPDNCAAETRSSGVCRQQTNRKQYSNCNNFFHACIIFYRVR